jgi:hypothetical protein
VIELERHVGVVVFAVARIAFDVFDHLGRLRAAVRALDAVSPVGDRRQRFARLQQQCDLLLSAIEPTAR